MTVVVHEVHSLKESDVLGPFVRSLRIRSAFEFYL